MNTKLLISKMRPEIEGKISMYVGFASFEKRCLTILSVIATSVSKFLFFSNIGAGKIAHSNLEAMILQAGDHYKAIELDLDNPTLTIDRIKAVVSDITSAPPGDIFVDITTFTHEQLLIFFHVLSESKTGRKFIFGYTGASQYSTNSSPDHVWLSRGVSEIRSVLGFPGEFRPSKKLHLIVLVGFEHERAKAVIEQFEPAVLTLGICEASQSVSTELFETNQKFFDEVRRFVEIRTSIYSEVQTFEFSGVDAEMTCNKLLELTASRSAYNTVVCPMNTKISTLGTGLAGIRNKQIQICYSRAIEYNELGYSTPSDHVTLFEPMLA